MKGVEHFPAIPCNKKNLQVWVAWKKIGSSRTFSGKSPEKSKAFFETPGFCVKSLNIERPEIKKQKQQENLSSVHSTEKSADEECFYSFVPSIKIKYTTKKNTELTSYKIEDDPGPDLAKKTAKASQEFELSEKNIKNIVKELFPSKERQDNLERKNHARYKSEFSVYGKSLIKPLVPVQPFEINLPFSARRSSFINRQNLNFNQGVKLHNFNNYF